MVLYLVSLEVNQKKLIIKQNEELHTQIEQLLSSESPKEKLLKICYDMDISARDTAIATMYYIDKYKPKDIWYWLIENKENMELDSVYKLLNRLNKKILNKLN